MDPALLAALTALLVACGANTIRADYAGQRWHVYVCKPLTILAAMAIAASGAGGPEAPYRALVLAGLACSLVGDTFLMLPEKRFVAGLASFLVAHLCYIAAFATAAPDPAPALLLLTAGAIGVAVAWPLWPHLGRVRVPVALYIVVLMVMLWQAAGWAATSGAPRARLAAAGALLFTVSDGVLAHNRFRRPFRAAQAVILTTYFLAQWMFAATAGTGRLW